MDIKSLQDLEKKFKIVMRRPKIGDLVFVPAQMKILEVFHVESMTVWVRTNGGSLKLPVSQYKLVERKKPSKKK